MLQEFGGDFIQWLRGFYYTATCGNMTAAMKEMHRNQSALTYQIKSLEKEFGVKLFSGSKNNRVLTEEGKLLLTRASQLFSFIKELREQLINLPTDIRGELRISAMFSFYNHILPQLVERFVKCHQEVQLRLHSSLMENKLFEDVSSGKVDIGIVASNRIPDEFSTVPLFSSDLALITPRHIWPENGEPTLDFISTLPLGATSPKSSLWLNISMQSEQYGYKLKPKHIIDHQDCLLHCVSSGICSTILDSFVVDDFQKLPYLNIFPLRHIFRPRQYYSVMLKNTPYHYPQVKAFFAFLMHEFEVPDFLRGNE